MANNDFRISLWTVWSVVIIADLMIVYGIYIQLSQTDASSFFFIAGSILAVAVMIILVNDILNKNVYNKAFWLIAMIVIAPITSVYYLLQRNKLIQLGQQNHQ
ncbi:MAG: hypothetical protein M9887_02610 [Chitinophagales bacterium]|nr:hypothetical protein [Chitinophagales bacterium]